MATELEFKLAVSTPALLEQILFDAQITEVRREPFRLLEMATVYYDTPDRDLQSRRWTLRLRQENFDLIATCKTPGDGHARGEWSCPASCIEDALPVLVQQGAPQELLTLTEGKPLAPQCVAQFSRRAADVCFADGTVCEFCGDIGRLAGGRNQEDFCELELELKEGNEETAAAFVQELAERFDLQEEPRSKFARAAALAERE